MAISQKNKSGIPDHEIESLARNLLPTIRKYYESEEGQREFAEWKAKQEKDKQGSNK